MPGKPALQVYAAVVQALNKAHVGVILNNHVTDAEWCCGSDPCNDDWFNTDATGCNLPQSQEQWIEDWETIARLTVGYPWVIGADLRNEIRGNLTWNQWASAAEEAAARIHAINPNLLIIVEGLNYAQDLTGVRTRPVVLQQPNKLVYSAHTYSWFDNGTDYATKMTQQWGYIAQTSNSFTAPLWVGEVGVPEASAGASSADLSFWAGAVSYVGTQHIGFSYWALNTTKPSGEAETYTVLQPDWSAGVQDYRLQAIQALAVSP